MRILLSAVVMTILVPGAGAAPLPFILRDGRPHLAASVLEREAGIVIKQLPGRGEFVACGAERCVPLKSVLAEGDTWLVPVAGLSAALGYAAEFDEPRRQVTMVPASRGSSDPPGTARVGTLAPSLHFTQLDGTSVTLDELRGQRVLINSWASW